MQLSGFTKGALVLAGLCALTAPAAAGCGPSSSTTQATDHPYDQLLRADDVPSGFTKAARALPGTLGCTALDQTLFGTGQDKAAAAVFENNGDDIVERITVTAGVSEADAVLKSVTADLRSCPTSKATRTPGGTLTGRVLDYRVVDPPPAVGDGSVVARVYTGFGLVVFSHDLVVIRKGAEVVELWHGTGPYSTNAEVSDLDLAEKALARLG